MSVDFGKTASDYARHRAGFPDAFFDRLTALRHIRSGDRVLDLGTGTGTVARGLAKRGCVVTGLDPAAPLIEQARRLDEQAGVVSRYVEGRAEETGLADAMFDIVVAGQCWHWFDRPRAATEAKRVLRPQGRLIIAHFDWLPLPGNMVEATERLILRHNPAWNMGGGTGIYPAWLADAANAGFQNLETFSFDLPVPYSHEAWRGRIRASAGVAASLVPDQVAAFDRELSALLAERFPAEPLIVPHRVWAMTGTAPLP